MKSLFSYSNYREYLIDLAEDRKLKGRTKAELARILDCQAAYLSQVFAGNVDLTEEHLLRLAEHLEMNEVETEYLLTLLRHTKAGNQNLQRYLGRQLHRLKEISQEVEPRISAKTISMNQELTLYYSSSWIPSIIHLATNCEDFQSVESISKRFGLPEEVVLHHLQRLEKFELIQFTEDKWKMTNKSVHFSKDSPLDLQIQTSRRLLAMNRLAVRKKSDLHYSVIFSTDLKTARALREHFLEAIERLYKVAGPSKDEDVYGVCLDFFLV